MSWISGKWVAFASSFFPKQLRWVVWLIQLFNQVETVEKTSALLCRVIVAHIRTLPRSYRVLTITFGKVFYREQAGRLQLKRLFPVEHTIIWVRSFEMIPKRIFDVRSLKFWYIKQPMNLVRSLIDSFDAKWFEWSRNINSYSYHPKIINRHAYLITFFPKHFVSMSATYLCEFRIRVSFDPAARANLFWCGSTQAWFSCRSLAAFFRTKKPELVPRYLF